MRRTLYLFVLLPAVVLAAGKADFLRVRNVVNDGKTVNSDVPWFEPVVRPANGTDFPGVLDTVGGTTYEWQMNGAQWPSLYYDPNYGVHVAWMFSNDQGPGYPDRNMRYNFYDVAGSPPSWVFNQGSNYMDWGVSGWGVKVGFGMMDVNVTTGCAYMSAHRGDIYPSLVQDAAPGSGTFGECEGTPVCDGYCWPAFGVGQSQKPHVMVLDNDTRALLFYSAVDPWCTWSVPAAIPSPAPDPGFPNYTVAASKISGKVAVLWEDYNSTPEPAYYRVSLDDGASWQNPQLLPFPPAFSPGSDSNPSFNIAGLCVYFDARDTMHFVAVVSPDINGTTYILPAELWHWTEATSWTRIHRGTCDTVNLMGGVGYNALYASRPTLGEDPATGDLVCAWEQFDSMNIESSTALMRADVYVARGNSSGTAWGPALRITDPDMTSKRFPCVANRTLGDTVLVRYEFDQVAGMSLYSQGPVTNNPFVVHKVPIQQIPSPAVAEGNGMRPSRCDVAALPNPFRGGTVVRFQLPMDGAAGISVHDAAGRLVERLATGNRSAGVHHIEWRPVGIRPGVYFITLAAGKTVVTRKLTLLP